MRSGYDAGLVVEMRNVSNEPLPLDVDDSCGTFDAVASNDKTTSFETDCFGMCAGGPEPHVLRVSRHIGAGPIWKDDAEFVPAETRQGVNFAHTSPQSLRHGHQESIADRMAQRVIHLFEVVKIDKQDRDHLSALHLE